MTTELSDSTARYDPPLTDFEKKLMQHLERYRSRRTLSLSAQTARLASTPAPYGKPGGPGLYGVKGLKHSDYFEHVVQALMRGGRSKAEASQMAWGILRRWAKGGGKVHPEVRAAATAALAEEKVASARARAVHGHTNSAENVIELFGTTAGAAKHQRVPAGQPGGGQFTKGQQQQSRGGKQKKAKQRQKGPSRPQAHGASGKSGQIAGLRTQLSKVNAAIRQAHAAITADLAAAKAAKSAARKTTTGKSPAAVAAAAKAKAAATSTAAAAKKSATATSTTARTAAASASRLPADRAKLASLLQQRRNIKARLKALGA